MLCKLFGKQQALAGENPHGTFRHGPSQPKELPGKAKVLSNASIGLASKQQPQITGISETETRSKGQPPVKEKGITKTKRDYVAFGRERGIVAVHGGKRNGKDGGDGNVGSGAAVDVDVDIDMDMDMDDDERGKDMDMVMDVDMEARSEEVVSERSNGEDLGDLNSGPPNAKVGKGRRNPAAHLAKPVGVVSKANAKKAGNRVGRQKKGTRKVKRGGGATMNGENEVDDEEGEWLPS